MCGIVGYIGYRRASDVLIKGLQRLEYRGYDSAGIALLNGDLKIYKKAGKVKELIDYMAPLDQSGNVGIGHTRWATHGAPTDYNAHPHLSESKDLAIIHNGIIENYDSLKSELIQRGHTFHSDTDTEVLIHLIEDIQQKIKVELQEAVRIALTQVIGAYAITIISKNHPNKLIAARKGSPLVVGIGKGEYFIASDASPIVEYTKNVIYLNDDEIAIIKDGELVVKTIENQIKAPYIQELEVHLEMIEKSGYDHFMLKEIYEQPHAVKDSMRRRVSVIKNEIQLGGIREYEDVLVNANRIIIVACGTSWHAGMVGEYLIEEFARIPVEVEYASEFRYRDPVINKNDVVIAISQSGETADTLAALGLAKKKGAILIGICNVVGSSIPRLTDAGIYTHAGPEIGVASTKAFTTQVVVLTMLALQLARRKKTITEKKFKEMVIELDKIPDKITQVLETNTEIKQISEIFKGSTNFLYLGRGYHFPVALEGALKLKEISYIHAEGYPAAEMKHGPIALIDEAMPVVFIATRASSYEKILSNIQEVKARKGRVIGIVSEGDTAVKELAEFVIEIPHAPEPLVPLLAIIPLQLLSYHIAVMRGCDVDQPRNLAKSVTVE